jgi:hypothetical protein
MHLDAADAFETRAGCFMVKPIIHQTCGCTTHVAAYVHLAGCMCMMHGHTAHLQSRVIHYMHIADRHLQGSKIVTELCVNQLGGA